ncbi:hypothetical protein F3Y22_tig00111027pilonHSYRG00752 [Hibiscus syriacus]|uniref:Uncharacterized protein n=1 Tax=Hibiscus syriacus TaxID=106335 RepID=A0A6A2Z5N7_HIBSY|nr:hypothetical protein F3Y22_tig00111027pilonHSYRG00752 [Hibiscus syriacus]
MEFEDPYRQAPRPKFDCLLFDLDDTLYSLSSGLSRECGKNIKDYMAEKLGIEKDQIVELSNLLYKNYGTTIAGLRAIGYDFDYDEYHSYVHGSLPYDNLKPDPQLRNLLLTLPPRKIVHSDNALIKLGLEDCFEGIICFETLNPTHKTTVSDDEDELEFLGSAVAKPDDLNNPEIFDINGHFAEPNPSGSSTLPKTPIVCKPQESAIELALKIAKINPQKTLFFDGSVRNIQAGKRVGVHTVLVGTSQRAKGADYALESIHNMKQALPELWETDMKSEVGYSGQVTVETPVTA